MTVVGAGLAIAETEKNTHVQNQTIAQLIQGRSNALVLATLSSNATSTHVTAVNCGAGCAIHESPTTANAAAIRASIYYTSITNGSFVVNHSSTSSTDCTFRFYTVG
jgi:alpha-D-ribose 1-methylphosphonate 5-triphosphate diphosphatase PhnM